MGYSREEVKAIIERAIDAQTARSDDVSHDELLAIGRELGLSGDALNAAAKDLRASREREAAEAEVRARARTGFLFHAIPFVLVHVAAIVTWLTAGGPPWFLATLIAWGIGLAFHARQTFWPDPRVLDRKVQRHVERERRRAERLAQKEAFDKVKRELGAGVAQALTSVADAVSAATKQPGEPRSRVRVSGEADEASPTKVSAVDEARSEVSREERTSRGARRP